MILQRKKGSKIQIFFSIHRKICLVNSTYPFPPGLMRVSNTVFIDGFFKCGYAF